MDATRGARRVAAVAVLLAIAVVGLRARGTFSRTPDSAAAGASGTVLVIALAVAEGVAFVAFIVVLASARPSRQEEEEEEDQTWRPRLPWWVKTFGVLAALAALVTPFAVLFARKTARRAAAPAPVARPGHPFGLAHAAPAQAGLWPVIAGMVLAVALVLALALLSRRRRQDGPRRPPDRAAALAQSLAAGRAALEAATEPRAAIIACYAAMERGFAAAGSAPAAADTPAEVLIRATGAGLVSAPPAEALAGLFRRARYSSELMTSTDSAAAGTALARLRAELGQP